MLGALDCASNDAAPTTCSDGHCTFDGGSDGSVTRDDSAPPSQDAAVDAAPNRNPLCGLVGCFPGNLSACGTPTDPDAGPYGGLPLDAGASDGADGHASDAAAPTADAAAPSSDAAATNNADAHASADAASDASVRDASVGGERNAPFDAGTSDISLVPAFDSSTAIRLDASDADNAMSDASGVNDATMTASDAGSIISEDASDARPSRASDAGPIEPVIPKSCQVKFANAGVVTSCEPYGTQTEGAACNDSSECEASLACVDVKKGSGVCRPLRCALPISCPPGTFYREAPLRADGVTRKDMLVPVCLPDDHCAVLAEHNPCDPGEVCAIVGTEGETSCVVPGTAGVDDPCDDAKRCSDGLVCTKHKNTCVKLCHVERGNAECMQGACEGGNKSLPADLGICVGEVRPMP